MAKKASKKRRHPSPKENKKPTRTVRLIFDLGHSYMRWAERHIETVVNIYRLQEQRTAVGPAGGDGAQIQAIDDEIASLITNRDLYRGRLSRAAYLLGPKLTRHGCNLEPIVEFQDGGWIDLELLNKVGVQLGILRTRRRFELSRLRKKRRTSQAKPAADTPKVATAKWDGELAALIVDAGRLRVTYKGHTCDFKASDTFDLMKNLAKHPGVPILAERKAVVSRLRTRLRKDEALAPIAKAIVSKRDRLYMLDPDPIGGVTLVEAPVLG